jgi:hypothetical protein
MTIALVRHSESRGDAARSVCVHAARNEGILRLTYVIEGDVSRLRMPPVAAPRIAHGLWHHTCCEIFIARQGAAAYHEFNLAPSREWAAYAFARYREGGPLEDEALNPEIEVRTAADRLELDAAIRLERLSHVYPGARLALALSAVIEDEAGALSYWALRHPPGKPDFHHPDQFALELDEARD